MDYQTQSDAVPRGMVGMRFVLSKFSLSNVVEGVSGTSPEPIAQTLGSFNRWIRHGRGSEAEHELEQHQRHYAGAKQATGHDDDEAVERVAATLRRVPGQ
jgi:hypothetical protein